MPPRKPASDIPKHLSTRQLVLIKRDQTAATPRAVWSHEIPILEAVFGEGNATIVEPDTLDEGYTSKPKPDLLIYNKTQDPVRRPSETQGLGFVFYGDPRSEFDRLCNLYGRHPDVNETYAEYVFGRFNTKIFENLVGSPDLDDLPDDQLRTLVAAYGYIPQIGDRASDEERKVVSAKQKELREASRDALLQIAADLGVELR